jgi:hypothetical protein
MLSICNQAQGFLSASKRQYVYSSIAFIFDKYEIKYGGVLKIIK